MPRRYGELSTALNPSQNGPSTSGTFWLSKSLAIDELGASLPVMRSSNKTRKMERPKKAAPVSIRPTGRYGDSVLLLIMLVAHPPMRAPNVPPMPINANTRLPCSTV